MRAIAVDDEKMGLSRITRLLSESEYISYIKGYTNSKEALEHIEEDAADIAFLDIEMPEINGLMLAELLMERNPKLQVIFLTAYDKYAMQAFEVNAIGYLLKPVELKKINEKLERVLKIYKSAPPTTSPKIYVQVFKNFLVSSDSDMKKLMEFRTEKAKELLGYLLSFNGKPVSKDKLIDILWEAMEPEKAAKNLHTNFYYLRKTFKSIGIEEVILRNQNGYSINEKYIESDLKVFSQGIEELNNRNPNIEIIKEAISKYTGYYFEVEDYLWIYERQVYFAEAFEGMGMFLVEHYEEIGEDKEVEKTLKYILKNNPLAEKAYAKLIKLYLKQGDKLNSNKIYQSFKVNFGEELSEEYLKELLIKK